MVLLESSFLIDVMRNNKDALDLLAALEQKEQMFYIPTPSIMELWIGALESKLPEQEKAKIEELLASFRSLPLDIESAKRAAEVDSDLSQRGLRIETADVMIAGIALVHGETVVTRDEHYARIPGLRVLKY